MASSESHGLTTDLIEVIPGGDDSTAIEGVVATLEAIGAARISLEMVGRDSGVRYYVRSDAMSVVRHQLGFHLPGIEIRDVPEDEDPLRLNTSEQAWSRFLHFEGEECLPLRAVENERDAHASLASIAGALTAAQAGESVITRTGASSRTKGSWFDRYRRYVDPDDDGRTSGGRSSFDLDFVAKLAALFVLAAGGIGYWFGLSGGHEHALNVALIWAGIAVGALVVAVVFGLWKRFRGRSAFSPDAEDIQRMRWKSRRKVFDAVLEIVVKVPSGSRAERAGELADGLVDAYGWYEVVDKRRIRGGGRVRTVRKFDPSAIWNFGKHRTVLAAEEVAGLWHPPDRMLLARTRDLATSLASGGEGALVGTTTGSDAGGPVYFPDAQFNNHMFFIASSGMGKSTLMQHVISYKLAQKAAGQDDTAIVVIDPHADLIEGILPLVPENIIDKIVLVDLGNSERVPSINLLDATMFRDRERTVHALIEMLKRQWEFWGPQMERYLRLALTTLHAANCVREPEEQYTFLDLGSLLTDAGFRRRVRADVTDHSILDLWDAYDLEAGREDRLVPVKARLDAYALSPSARAVLGQSRSTIDIPSILENGGVLLVNSASGTVGGQVGTLVGGAIITLVESTVRGYEQRAPEDRPRTLLVVDEAQAIAGIDYEAILSELRKYGVGMIMATQNLARLRQLSPSMQATVLTNQGTLVVFRTSGEDARQLVWELDRDRIREAAITGQNAFVAIVKRDINGQRHPVFQMRLRPPQLGDPDMADRIRAAAESYTIIVTDV